MPVDINKIKADAIQHDETALKTSVCKSLPLQFVDHGCDTAGAVVVTTDVSGTSPLNHFNLVDIPLGMWIPCCCSIFHDWSNIGEVGSLFDLGVAASEVTAKEGANRVCFLDCDINVGVEVQLLVDVDTKVLGRIDFFQVMITYVVLTDNWVPLVCHSQDLALGRMKLHLPCLLPLL